MNELKCPEHPRYTAKRKPTGKCKICWEIRNAKNKEIFDYKKDRIETDIRL